MASYTDILKKSTSKPLESKRKLMIVEQAWPINCNTLINNPGFSHITSRIFGHLDHKSQLQCRLVGKSWKKHVDQPLFWLKKLEKKGQSKKLSNAWCDLFQNIEEGSFLEEKLRECLMKWHDLCHKGIESELDGITPIYIASRLGCFDIVELFASYTDNLNIAKTDGWTPIHAAAQWGHMEIVKFLASKVENPNDPMPDGWTLIQSAAGSGYTEIVKFLVPRVENPNAPNPNGWTPIHHAVYYGYTEIFKFIAHYVQNLHASDPLGKTPLQRAVEKGHTEIVGILLKMLNEKFSSDPKSVMQDLSRIIL